MKFRSAQRMKPVGGASGVLGPNLMEEVDEGARRLGAR